MYGLSPDYHDLKLFKRLVYPTDSVKSVRRVGGGGQGLDPLLVYCLVSRIYKHPWHSGFL